MFLLAVTLPLAVTRLCRAVVLPSGAENTLFPLPVMTRLPGPSMVLTNLAVLLLEEAVPVLTVSVLPALIMPWPWRERVELLLILIVLLLRIYQALDKLIMLFTESVPP